MPASDLTTAPSLEHAARIIAARISRDCRLVDPAAVMAELDVHLAAALFETSVERVTLLVLDRVRLPEPRTGVRDVA